MFKQIWSLGFAIAIVTSSNAFAASPGHEEGDLSSGAAWKIDVPDRVP